MKSTHMKGSTQTRPLYGTEICILQDQKPDSISDNTLHFVTLFCLPRLSAAVLRMFSIYTHPHECNIYSAYVHSLSAKHKPHIYMLALATSSAQTTPQQAPRTK